MARIDLGFDTHELFTFNLDLPVARYGNDTELPTFYEKTLSELGSIAGVRAVAVANRVPVLGGESPGPVTVDGRVVARPADQPWATSTKASPTFFEAAGIAMLAGRAFSRDDNAERVPVAIVNREMAKRYWGSTEAALGKRVAFGGAGSNRVGSPSLASPAIPNRQTSRSRQARRSTCPSRNSRRAPRRSSFDLRSRVNWRRKCGQRCAVSIRALPFTTCARWTNRRPSTCPATTSS